MRRFIFVICITVYGSWAEARPLALDPLGIGVPIFSVIVEYTDRDSGKDVRAKGWIYQAEPNRTEISVAFYAERGRRALLSVERQKVVDLVLQYGAKKQRRWMIPRTTGAFSAGQLNGISVERSQDNTTRGKLRGLIFSFDDWLREGQGKTRGRPIKTEKGYRTHLFTKAAYRLPTQPFSWRVPDLRKDQRFVLDFGGDPASGKDKVVPVHVLGYSHDGLAYFTLVDYKLFQSTPPEKFYQTMVWTVEASILRLASDSLYAEAANDYFEGISRDQPAAWILANKAQFDFGQPEHTLSVSVPEGADFEQTLNQLRQQLGGKLRLPLQADMHQDETLCSPLRLGLLGNFIPPG